MSERPKPPTEADLPDELSIVEVPGGTAPAKGNRSQGMLGIIIAALLGSATAFGLFFAAKSYLLPSQEQETIPERTLPVKVEKDEPELSYPDLVRAEKEEKQDNPSAPSTKTVREQTKPPVEQPTEVASADSHSTNEPSSKLNNNPSSVRPSVPNSVPAKSNNTPAALNNRPEAPVENTQESKPKSGRYPKPEEQAIAQANQDVEAAFSQQIRKAKTREEKIVLAHTLSQAAQGEPAGSATRFVLLEHAHKMAVDAPDPDLTNEITSSITSEYDVDSFAYRMFAVEEWDDMRLPGLDPEAEKLAHRMLAREAGILGDQAYQRKNFKTAAVMYALASKRRERAGDREISNLFRAKRTAARTKETRYSLASSLLEGLKANPDDAAKNLEAGIACVQAGLWEPGLECLTRSSDESLKTFAAEQLKLRANPDSLLQAGDQSWDALGQLDRRHALWLKELAVSDYESVLGKLTPLQRQRIKLRMQQVGPVTCVLPAEIQRFAFESKDFVEIDKLNVLQNRMGHFGNGQLYGKQTLALGIRGSALAMDGSNTMIVCPETEFLIPGDWPFTISIWINSERPQDVVIAGRTFQQSTAMKPDFQMRLLSSGHLQGMLAPETGGVISVESRDPVPQGQWAHLAMTWDLESLKLYYNGRESASLSATSPRAERILGNRAWMAIGAESRYKPKFQGKVDEMRVYDQALTPLQIYHVYLEDQTPED